jgi:Septum formation
VPSTPSGPPSAASDPWASPPQYSPYRDPSWPGGPRPPAYPDPPSRTMAGWALGLAIVPCCFGISTLVGIGLAITVLVRSRHGQNHGKGLAIAALVIGPLWIIGGIVAGVAGALDDLTQDADRDSAGRVTDRSTISVLKLRDGDCFNQTAIADKLDDETVETKEAEVMPCSDLHQFEVYEVYDLPDGDYPGEDKLSRSSALRCITAFADFVGKPYGKSRLEPYVLYPQPFSWRVLHDRSVTCFVGEPHRLTTGTLEGSRR